MNTMIQVSFGTILHDSDHELQVVSLEDVVGYIKEGSHGVEHHTGILRTVRKYDADRYRHMKTQLPFFGMSIFSPSYRSVNNFLEARGLILDLDFQDTIPEDLISRIHGDPRICLAYVSPSGVGMKLVFLMETAISSSAAYSQYYKSFAHSFAQEYHLMDVLDFKNSDVSRISFLSFDPDAYFNPNPIMLDSNEFDDEMLDDSDESSDGLTPDVYKEILRKLDTRPVRVEEELSLIPAIERIRNSVSSYLLEYGIHIDSQQSLPYGVKLRLRLGSDLGEVNIYHGKNGYSVASSPRKGTSARLNEVAVHVVTAALATYDNY